MGRLAAAVAFGGAIGALLRFGLSLAVLELARRLPEPARLWPFGTFTVNMVGCAAIGVVAGLLEARWSPGVEARAFVLVGVLGGFTTFSTFAFEAAQLFEDGRAGVAVGYLLLSPVLGLVLALVGWSVGRAM